MREFDFSLNERLPSLIFVDIQKSQIDEHAKMIADATGEAPEQVPTVRATRTSALTAASSQAQAFALRP